MSRLMPVMIAALIVLSGCVSLRETQPPQTAREQLLLSTAADRASQQIAPNIPQGDKIYVDTGNFGSGADFQSQYAINAIKSVLLRRGYALASSEGEADTVLIVSSGALSIDQTDKLFGIPSGSIPIPLAGPLETPEVSFWKSKDRTGVAKFLLTFYDAETGELQDGNRPVYGFSHFNRSSLLFYAYTESDLLPLRVEHRDPTLRILPESLRIGSLSQAQESKKNAKEAASSRDDPDFADRMAVPPR